MRTVITAAAILALSTSVAAAQSIADEIQGYRDINVAFSSDAESCNLTDPKMFSDQLAKKLADIGVTKNPDSPLEANLGINAKAFGTLSTSCTFYTEMTFSAVLLASNIVTDDPTARAALDRLKTIPVIIYEAGRFGTAGLNQPAQGGPSTTAQERVKKDIDTMVDNFAALRKK